MAKIDVTKIEGYEDMTPEEKLAALEAFEYDDNAAELDKYKKAATKANTEAAEWKRKHKELLTEDERNKLARDEELAELHSELEHLKKDKLVSGHKAEFLALGYDDALASVTAQAMADGDMATVFANQKKFLETHDKTLKTELLKKTPKPPAGGGTDGMTIEEFRKMTQQERYEYSVKNPEEYKKLYGGNE